MEEIIVQDTLKKSFNIKHILECGQVFRFGIFNGNYYVLSKGECAFVRNMGEYYKIECTNKKYFEKYFDFYTDYDIIKHNLSGNNIVNKAIQSGYGIRLLKQDLFETIISFILSSNNNIPRIKGMIERLCSSLGSKREFLGFEYYTFPTLDELVKKDEEFFRGLGFGFRAKYIEQTAKMLKNSFDMNLLFDMSTKEAREKLLTLMGVGRKVADCILLFGLSKMDVFPVDTWVEKIYNDYFFDGVKTREKQADYLVSKFKNLSGYAQQYLFYYKRENSF